MLEMEQSKKSISKPSLVVFLCWVFVKRVSDLPHGPFYLFVSTKVRCEDVLLSLSCPGSSIVEHGVERITRVAILFKHSVAILGPFMNKHIPWYYVFVKTISILRVPGGPNTSEDSPSISVMNFSVTWRETN